MTTPEHVMLLDPAVVEQIAAGEVVERPASLVRELVENALDAGSRRVDVVIAGGGKKLVSVADDGRGIAAGDVEVALQRHATSKLREVDDLLRIRTMGFRGEGLSSVAAVTRLQLHSRAAHEDCGVLVNVAAGVASPPQPKARKAGTTVKAADLFFNVPARREFLKSSATEGAHVHDEITRRALGYPSVSFSLVADGRTVMELQGARSRASRVREILGRRAEHLVTGTFATAGMELEAVITGPGGALSTSRGLSLIINKRSVRDRLLLNAALRGFADGGGSGKYPAGAIFLDIEMEQLDINVHPQKQEVRFIRPERVYGAVANVVRRALGVSSPRVVAHAPGAATVREPGPTVSRSYVLGNGGGGPAPSSDAAAVEGESIGQSKSSPDYLDARQQMREATRRFWVQRRAVEAAEQRGDYGLDGALARDEGPVQKPAGQPACLIAEQGAVWVCQQEDDLLILRGGRTREILHRTRLVAELAAAGIERAEPASPVALDARLNPQQAALLSRYGLVVEHFGGEHWVLREVPAGLEGVAPPIAARVVEDALMATKGHSERRDELVVAVLAKALSCMAEPPAARVIAELTRLGVDLRRFSTRYALEDDGAAGLLISPEEL